MSRGVTTEKIVNYRGHNLTIEHGVRGTRRRAQGTRELRDQRDGQREEFRISEGIKHRVKGF